MKQMTFMEKYPIFTIEIDKSECKFANASDIAMYFKDLIDKDEVAAYIGEFDHYAHTKGLDEGVVAPEILDARLVVFCFGQKLPSPQMLAARPRSVGICERENDFVISFLEAPMPAINEKMELWSKALVKE